MAFEIDHNIRIRTLGDQVTVYDLEGNIIDQIPPPPAVPPTVRYVNIIEIEDRIMGIDSTASPDYFIDFETDERFFKVEIDPKYNRELKFFERSSLKIAVCVLIIIHIIAGLVYVAL